MSNHVWRAVGAVGGVLLSGSVWALTMTYTGSELLDVATFPAQSPQVVGSSLLLGATSSYGHPKVMKLYLPRLGNGPVRITTRLGLTRQACDMSAGCAGATDFDPTFGLSDGVLLVGATLKDKGFRGGADMLASVQGTTVNGMLSFADSRPVGILAPGGGHAFELVGTYELGSTGTQVKTEYDKSASVVNSSVVLDRGSLEFVYIRDKDRGEQVQIDYLTIDIEEVEPDAVAAVAHDMSH